MSPDSATVLRVLPVPGPVWGLAYDPANGFVYATLNESSAVVVLNSTSGQLVTTIPVGSQPRAIGYDPGTGNVYAANYGSDNVSVINTTSDRVVGNLPVGSNPDGVLAIGAPLYRLFVANQGSANVSVVDTRSESAVASAPTGPSPGGLAYDPATREVYVADWTWGNITVVNASSGSRVKDFATGLPCPDGVAYNAYDHFLYFDDTHCGPHLGGDVAIVNATTGKVTKFLATGDRPVAVVFDPKNTDLYTANYDSNNVTVLSGRSDSVAGTVALIVSPSALAYDPANGDVYATVSDRNDVWVLNGSTGSVVATIPVGGGPDGIAYDPANERIYVANFDSDNVSVINASSQTVVGAVAVGLGPTGLAVSVGPGRVLVSNQNSGNVSVIQTLNDAVIANLPVGAAPAGMALDSMNGLLYVVDSGSAYGWTPGGDMVSVVDPRSDSIVANVSVGSYPDGITFDESNRLVYVSNGESGDLSVINTSLNQNIGSVSTSYGPLDVAFDPLNGEIWSGTTQSQADPAANEVVVTDGLTNTVRGEVSVGTYPRAIAFDTANGYAFIANADSGTVSVLEPARYPADLFNVSFVESGLPRGTPWSVDVNGSTFTLSGTLLNFSETSGIHPFYIVAPPGFTSTPQSGRFHVGNTSVVIHLQFVAVVYPVTFEESGLPVGAFWEVLWNGSYLHSRTPVISTNATNGTYWYEVRPATYLFPGSNFTPSPAQGWAVVRGAPALVPVAFAVPFDAGPSPEILQFNATGAVVSIGESFLFASIEWGGLVPLTYAYSGLPGGCESANYSTLLCTPTTAGRFSVQLTVTDRLGRSASATTTVEVVTENVGVGASQPLPAEGFGGTFELVVGVLLAVSALEIATSPRLKRWLRPRPPRGPGGRQSVGARRR